MKDNFVRSESSLRFLLQVLAIVGVCSIPIVLRGQQVLKDGSVNADKMKKQYSSLRDDWKRKRAFCIDLIDKEIIKRGDKLAPALDIFGDDIFIVAGDPQAKCSALVLFQKQSSETHEYDESAPDAIGFDGWYLWIESEQEGKIERYHLSNIDK
jgi:hypothetical protein